jgi:hypothetical protein
MKSAKATRWTREAILMLGDIVARDDDGGAVVEGQEGTDGGSGQTEDKSKEGASGKADDDEDDVDPKILKQRLQNKREEQERDFKKRKEAEKRADDLQKIVDEAERKGKTELENAKSDLEARDKVIAGLNDTVRRLVIENAFMTLDQITWNNPATALKLVDLSDVEFDPETGKPKDKKQLLEAAKALAKSDPYLVKSKTAVTDETPNGKPSGKPPVVKGGDKIAADAAIAAKYNVHR